jgi:hypothetical protein
MIVESKPEYIADILPIIKESRDCEPLSRVVWINYSMHEQMGYPFLA